MKLASYTYGGKAKFGVVDGNSVSDLTGIAKDIVSAAVSPPSAADLAKAPKIALSDITFLPVIPQPQKIVCVGLNYDAHIKETGRGADAKYPTIFLRFADSQIGHGQPLVKPSNSDRFDFEGELAVIIGKTGRRVARADALKLVAGYSCYNEGSVRDWQRHTSQFSPGKNFPATGGFGPWMVTTDEIPDPQDLRLRTILNGEVMQDTPTADMVFPVDEIIEYVSGFTQLNPGDVIVSGTPGGVGDRRTPPVYMKPGDTVVIEISKIGELKNTIVEG
jgi:2-keto-4-pentenoate hydratase/2-oxohepta-3-ene-1,7-dioic acid hydratase in catechol pathway